jgi:hypothetical protein
VPIARDDDQYPGEKIMIGHSSLASQRRLGGHRSKLGIVLVSIGFVCTVPARGGDSPVFHPLFNGKDFTGWVLPADASLFSIEKGEIVGKTTEKKLSKNEFLATEKAYGDFVLKAKVKFRNGNSGIQFRSKRAENGAVSGPQADVADGYWGLLYEERGRGILERYPEEKAKALVKKNDWNDFVITAKGHHVTIDFNGTRIIDREDPIFEPTGIIALQLHVWPQPMEVRYKDLEIAELAP